MYQSKHIQISTTCVELFLRAFLLGLLLMGSLFTATPFILSSHVFAQAAPKVPHPHVISFKPHVVASTNKGIAHPPVPSQGTRERPPAVPHSLRTVPVSKRAKEKVKPHAVPQDLTIISSVPGGPNFQVGQLLTFEFAVSNTSLSTILTSHSGVAVGIALPAGLANIVVITSNWATNVSSTTSPAVFSSLYTGPTVSPGGVFPVITVIGVLTAAAVPVYTAGPGVFDGLVQGVATGVASASVSFGAGTPTPVVTPTPTSVPNPVVGIAANVPGGPNYHVGQNIALNLTVSNIDAVNTLGANGSVFVGDAFPFGLDNLNAFGGGNWSINTSSITSPSLFTATYTGPLIPPGGTFPALSITGTLTSGAMPLIQNITTVYDSQFPNAASNVAFVQLSVGASNLTPTPPPTLTSSLPDLRLTQSSVGGSTLQIGQTATYALNVSGTAIGGPVGASNPIKVVAVFPVGLRNVVTTGSNWSIVSTSTVSPSLIVATYRGQYPVATGAQLPPILIQGTVLNTAVPQLTSTAVLQVAGDSNPDNNLSNTTIQVAALGQAQLPPPSPTPILMSVVTPIATISSVVAPLPLSLPDLAVTQASIGTSPFLSGQQLGYVLSVKNVGLTGSVSSLIRLTEVIPVGLTNVSVNAGSSWRITQSSTTSPLLITATYVGSYPVMPGATLVPLIVIGKIAHGIISSMTATAVLGVAGDRNPSNNLANNTIFVTPSPLARSRKLSYTSRDNRHRR